MLGVFWPPLFLRSVRLLARAAPARLGCLGRVAWLMQCGVVGVVGFLLVRLVLLWADQ